MPTGQRPKKSKWEFQRSRIHMLLNRLESGDFKWSKKVQKDKVHTPTGKTKTRRFADGVVWHWEIDDVLRAAVENRDKVLQDRFLNSLTLPLYDKMYDKYNGKRREMIVGVFKAAKTSNKVYGIIKSAAEVAIGTNKLIDSLEIPKDYHKNRKK